MFGVGFRCGHGLRPGCEGLPHGKEDPWVGPAAGSLDWISPPQKYLFAVYPLYYTEASCWSVCREKPGQEKVAIATRMTTTEKTGCRALRKSWPSTAEACRAAACGAGGYDMKPHVTEFKKVDADMVLLFLTPTHAVRVIGVAQAMQFKPQWMS